MKSIKFSREIRNRLVVILAIIMVFVMILSGGALGDQESVNDYYVDVFSEDEYSHAITQVRENIDELKINGTFDGTNNVTLYYEMYEVDNPVGSIVLVHGFTENLYKYTEMINYYTSSGYSVYAYEQRGHGRSTHLGADNSQVNVEKFSYYVEDLKLFMDNIVNINADTDKDVIIYAHSMGGLVATLFLETYDSYFDSAILSSPMLGINSGSYPEFFAKIVSFGATTFGFGDEYILGQTEYTNETVETFEGSGTNCQERFEYGQSWKKSDDCFKMCGGSYRWLYQSYKAGEKATNYFNIKKIEIPVLLFQAGKDSFVDNDAQDKFVKYANNCTYVRFNESKHEIFNGDSETIQEYTNYIFDFLKNNANIDK